MEDIVEIDNIPGIIIENDNNFHYKILHNGEIRDLYKIEGKFIDAKKLVIRDIGYQEEPFLLKKMIEEIMISADDNINWKFLSIYNAHSNKYENKFIVIFSNVINIANPTKLRISKCQNLMKNN